MAIHVAILKRPYTRAILDGTKTIESRLMRAAMPPLDAVEQGDRIYIKVSAGPFVAVARAAKITTYRDLTPAAVEGLRRRYQPRVGGEDAYWQAKRDSRFAVFIELADVEPIDVGPAYRPINMRAWHVLDDAADPIREATLTAGAIRNGYISIDLHINAPGAPAASAPAPAQPWTLVLPDQTQVQTGPGRGRMLQYRGWRRHFQRHAVKPGDVARFVALGGGRYRVSFHKADGTDAA